MNNKLYSTDVAYLHSRLVNCPLDFRRLFHVSTTVCSNLCTQLDCVYYESLTSFSAHIMDAWRNGSVSDFDGLPQNQEVAGSNPAVFTVHILFSHAS